MPETDGVELRGRPGFWLRIDSDGFTMKYLLTRSRFEWSDVKGEFWISGPYVAFNVAEDAAARSSRRLRGAFAMQQKSFGFDAGIQASSYRVKPEALADLLNDWKSRAEARAAPS